MFTLGIGFSTSVSVSVCTHGLRVRSGLSRQIRFQSTSLGQQSPIYNEFGYKEVTLTTYSATITRNNRKTGVNVVPLVNRF